MSLNKADEMSLDDELAAAFLTGDDAGLTAEKEVVETSISTPANNPEIDPDPNDWDEPDDFPGQLAVDVYETADKLVVKARTAGIERKDLDVSISDNILTISGVLNGGDEDKATQWHIQECYWGEFSRTIALPVQIREDGVDAVLKDGVLTISFEKEKTEAPKRITIN